MGIDIEDNKIIYNSNHDDLLGTSVPNKSTEVRLKKTSIYSVFRRVKNKDKNKKGDSNPAIFALKGMQGFSISDSEKQKFFPNFLKILKRILDGKKIDLIIVMPSSYPIANIVALRVSKILKGIVVETNFLKKSKNSDVVNMSLNHVKDKDRHYVNRILKKIKKMPPNQDFSMKEIENRYRGYFNPLEYDDSCNIDISTLENILIVDDLYATGTSMGNAIDLIKNLNKDVSIEGLCLFSHLRK